MAPHSSILDWKNPMDRGAWWAAVHGVTKSQTRLNDFTFTFIMKRTSFWVLVVEGLEGLLRTIQLQLLYCLGHRLGLP